MARPLVCLQASSLSTMARPLVFLHGQASSLSTVARPLVHLLFVCNMDSSNANLYHHPQKVTFEMLSGPKGYTRYLQMTLGEK